MRDHAEQERQALVEFLRDPDLPAGASPAVLIPTGSAPTADAALLARVARHARAGTVFVDLDERAGAEFFEWLARITRWLRGVDGARSHLVLVVILAPGRSGADVRDRVVAAGGLPFFAPASYPRAESSVADRARVLWEHASELRARVARGIALSRGIEEPSESRPASGRTATVESRLPGGAGEGAT